MSKVLSTPDFVIPESVVILTTQPNDGNIFCLFFCGIFFFF